MRYLYNILVILILIFWSSCRKDFEYAPSTGNLEFSKDTVFLDTIFSNLSSSTYSLIVHNRNTDAVDIPLIRLANGTDSKYRLNVDGETGKEFQNIPILAQDSIYIFIETTVSSDELTDTEFLYTDVLQFDSGVNQQDVQLVTLVKDAVFLYPSTTSNNIPETILLDIDDDGNEILVEGFILNDNQLNFTNEKPYIIYGYATVVDGKELLIDAGARVHFHKNSGILVQEGGSLHINGELSSDSELLENEVIFEGDRLEPEFSNVSGQWGTLWLSTGSVGNSINYATIKNATIGVFVEGDEMLSSPTLEIKNTQIYNSASVNLWAKSSYINAENIVLGGAGNNSLYCNLGGKYSFIHTTIANYWENGFRTSAALKLDNFNTTETGKDLIKANFINCIIDGNNTIELALNSNNSNIFNYSFINCMISFNDDTNDFVENPLYDFDNINFFIEPILNEETDFLDANNSNYKIGELSKAKDNADLETSLLVPFDISGTDRTTMPDIGAYEAISEKNN